MDDRAAPHRATSVTPAGGLPQAGQSPPEQGPAAVDAIVQDLYRAHALALVRLAHMLVRDRESAEDIVQDAFVRLYRALPRLHDHDQVLPYLRTIVINGCRSALRGQRRAAQLRVEHDPPGSSAEAAVLLSEDRRVVFDAVARLPRRSREVLVLRYYLELSDTEIAAALGVSRGTVSSTASRAVAALGRALKEEL
ncbi:MAG TPA: SigE family RNA polymerase sigma factor [Streptosporangiaceae bacterium]|nr:SigE family RNA polymerase sigma factor [Streptosporangiaceae bacterium]